MTENGNRGDVSELRKVSRVLEQGKEKASRGLTKEEIQAGLDALWNDGGVEGALAAVERAAKLASVPREKKLALGIHEYLDDFAKQRNAHTWEDFPDIVNWKEGVLSALSEPDMEIVFNLDGIDNLWTSVMRAVSVGDRATDWELLQIKSNPEVWNRVTWYRNGSIVSNPFE